MDIRSCLQTTNDGSVANRKSYRKNDFDFDKTTEKTNFDPGNLTSPRKLRGGENALWGYGLTNMSSSSKEGSCKPKSTYCRKKIFVFLSAPSCGSLLTSLCLNTVSQPDTSNGLVSLLFLYKCIGSFLEKNNFFFKKQMNVNMNPAVLHTSPFTEQCSNSCVVTVHWSKSILTTYLHFVP